MTISHHEKFRTLQQAKIAEQPFQVQEPFFSTSHQIKLQLGAWHQLCGAALNKQCMLDWAGTLRDKILSRQGMFRLIAARLSTQM